MKQNSRMIQVPVTLDGSNRLKDRSVKLSFSTTREISTEDYMVMDSFHQSAGWLLFKENEITEEEIPDEDVEEDTEKSQSIQIRDALWVLYKAEGGNTQDKNNWNIFYRKHQQNFKAKILQKVYELEEG